AIAYGSTRLDEVGPTALLRTPGPVNKFPDLVRYLVQRLQTLCPRLGKVKLAQLLARAGLHLGVSTVGRIRRERPAPPPAAAHPLEPMPCAGRVTAQYPDHLWHVDLTTVPTSAAPPARSAACLLPLGQAERLVVSRRHTGPSGRARHGTECLSQRPCSGRLAPRLHSAQPATQFCHPPTRCRHRPGVDPVQWREEAVPAGGATVAVRRARRAEVTAGRRERSQPEEATPHPDQTTSRPLLPALVRDDKSISKLAPTAGGAASASFNKQLQACSLRRVTFNRRPR